MKFYKITFNRHIVLRPEHQQTHIVMLEALGKRSFMLVTGHTEDTPKLFRTGRVFDPDHECKYVSRANSAIPADYCYGDINHQVDLYMRNASSGTFFTEQTTGVVNVTKLNEPAQRAWFRQWGYQLLVRLLSNIEHPMPPGVKSRRLMDVMRAIADNGRIFVNGSNRSNIYERDQAVRAHKIRKAEGVSLAEAVRQAFRDEDATDLDTYMIENDNGTTRNAFGRIRDALESKRIYMDTIECDCGHIEHCHNTHDVEGDTWCDSCFEDNAVYCEDTDDYRSRDNAYWSERRSAYYTYDIDEDDDDDDDDDEGDSDSLMDYSTNVLRILSPDNNIKSSPHGNFLMGIELEMAAGDSISINNAVEDVRSELGEMYCVCKSDGSLPDDGLEIVTAPRGLDEHIRTFKQWDINSSYRAWDTGQCGMHIHIDSHAFSAMTLGKFLMFINHDDNADFLRKIAGRHPKRDRQAERYCAAEFQEVLDNPAKAIKGKHTERYRMVNLQNLRADESRRLGFGNRFVDGRYNTVELRVFRASLKKERLLAQIEFTHAAVMFCRVASYRDLNGASFIKWLKGSTSNTYPHLSDWYGVRRREGAKNAAPAQQSCTDVVPEPEPRPAEGTAVEVDVEMAFDLAYNGWIRNINGIPPYVPVTVPRAPPTQRELYENEVQTSRREAELAARRGNNLQRVAWQQRAQQYQRLLTQLARQQTLATTI